MSLALYSLLSTTVRDENNAALALLLHMKTEVGDVSKVAFYSYPTTCRIDSGEEVSSELWQSFVKNNEHENGPIHLYALEGEVNLVSWEDTKQIYSTNSQSIMFREKSKRLIRLSRAGFNANNTEALFCLEPGGTSSLFHVHKHGEEWVFKNVYPKWIQ